MEVDKITASIKVPAMARSLRYVLIIKYDGKMVLRQHTCNEWTIETFKELSPKLKEIMGKKLLSIISNDPGAVNY